MTYSLLIKLFYSMLCDSAYKTISLILLPTSTNSILLIPILQLKKLKPNLSIHSLNRYLLMAYLCLALKQAY